MGFKLRNFYFTDQYLYAPRTNFMDQLRTAAKDLYTHYSYNWNLYELPGKMWVPPGTYSTDATPGYYLSPTEFPEYAAGIDSNLLALHIPFSGKTLDPEIHNPDRGLTFPFGNKYVVDLYHLSYRFFTKNLSPFNP